MAVRTQIALDSEDHRRAKKKAAELGISLSEYIRRLVGSDLERRAPVSDVSELFDIVDSGESDIARHKDACIAAAVEEDHRRSTGQ